MSCLSQTLCTVCNVGALWPNGWMYQAAPPQKNGTQPPPQFSASVLCDQTAGRIKILLCTEVGLGPGDIVLYGNPAHHPKREALQPQFSAIPKGRKGVSLDSSEYRGQKRCFVRLLRIQRAEKVFRETPLNIEES